HRSDAGQTDASGELVVPSAATEAGMRTTGRISLCAVATIVVMSWGLHPSAQAQTNSWTPPKTPWGHPDLQGVYTNKDETNTPLERPAEFSGRSPKDFTAAHLAAE